MPPMSRPYPTAPVLAFLLALAACGPNREQRARDAQRAQVDDLAEQAAKLAAPNDSPVERARIPNRIGLAQVTDGTPDSVRIVSTNGAVVYTLARDTVRMQLGDSLVRDVRNKVNAHVDSASGNFGNFIARTVAGAVGSAMTFVMKTPVRDIQSARYEGGELHIERHSGLMGHTTVNAGGKHDGEKTTFAPADAQRFVDAIEARRRALGVR